VRSVAAGLLLLLLAGLPAAAQDMVLRAGRLYQAGITPADTDSGIRMWTQKTIRDDPLVVIRGGVIRSVRKGGPVPPGLPVRSWGEESFVTRGLVDAHTHLGLRGESDEAQLAVTPDVHAADAFHPTDGERRAVLAAGITTLLVAPGDRNLVAGRIAEVKPAPPEAGGWRIVERDRGLALSLVEASRVRGRAPTSLAGQRMEIEGTLPADRLVTVRVREPRETLAVRELSRQHPQAVPVGLVRLTDFLERRDYNDLIFGPLTPGADLLDLTAPSRHTEAGVALLFGTGWQRPAMLRMQALQAVRHGMDPIAARLALTGGALMGGPLNGLPADLVVWSGDPLDGASRVLAVMVDGVVLYEAEEER
jgi:imidazolonepropionase-like amidohydrolase